MVKEKEMLWNWKSFKVIVIYFISLKLVKKSLQYNYG